MKRQSKKMHQFTTEQLHRKSMEIICQLNDEALSALQEEKERIKLMKKTENKSSKRRKQKKQREKQNEKHRQRIHKKKYSHRKSH